MNPGIKLPALETEDYHAISEMFRAAGYQAISSTIETLYGRRAGTVPDGYVLIGQNETLTLSTPGKPNDPGIELLKQRLQSYFKSQDDAPSSVSGVRP